ncbi:hypothetical protein MCP1_70088 [Candidatus Terasakiella magnetica]|nr:hypothetical protein MCP1_70088 [Candidatus Terasakiella magnetica]
MPNPLRETVMASISRDELRRRVRGAWTLVNEHRIERQTIQVGWLVARIREALAQRPPSDTAAALIGDLRDCATELRLRVAGTGFDHVAHLAATMIDICQGLGQNICDPDQRWLAVLPQIAGAVAKSFSRERECIRASRQISEAVGRHTQVVH